MRRKNIFDMADAATPEWATATKQKNTIACRLRVSVAANGELKRRYEWRVNGKRVRQERALEALCN